MAEAIVGPLVNKLQELVLQEVTALGGVSNDIRSLRDKLMWLHAFVHETHLRSRQDGSELLRVLARQTREAAFEAEDAIDEFLVQVDLSRFKHHWVRAVGAFFANFSTQIPVRRSLARKVSDLNMRLEGIIENSSKYSVDHTARVTGFNPWRASLASATIPAPGQDWDDTMQPELIGRIYEKKKLVEKLFSMSTPEGSALEKKNTSEGSALEKKNAAEVDVICIIGESGVGKTALVRDVYEDTNFRDYFEVRVWASFPPDSSVAMIVQLIYEKLFLECLSNSLLEDLEQHRPYADDYKDKVHKALENKSYLLVIDSPISNCKWNKVRPRLPKDRIDSRIVLIATSWPGKNFIKLNRLEYWQSKDLFIKTLGIKKESSTSLCDVKDITRGQPLFVVLLAKLLKTKEDDQWEHVFAYIKKSNEQDDRFRTILSLIFDDLPNELKSCLLYFTGFPENTVVNAYQLVHLWMAEGFLSTKKGMIEMEQLGQCYLKELISRGLVQLIKKDVHGLVELVAIHDHIHAFVRLEAQHTCFMEVLYGSFARASPNARRLSLENYNKKFATLANCLSALRSVLWYFKEDNYTRDEEQDRLVMPYCMAWRQGPEGEPSRNHSKLDMLQLLQGSPFLRVIDLEGLDIDNKLPKEIGDMVHLRYLGVRRCRSLKKVPASIGRLSNLQTFDMRGTAIRKLPKSFWKIKALRHVLGDDLLFPITAGDLELLRTLGTITVKHVNANGRFNAILKKMISLHSLHLVGLKESHNQALQDALDKLILLLRLRLSGEVIQIDFTRTSLDQLEYMELEGKLDIDLPPGKYPSYILVNLTHLELKSTHVKQAFVDMLASLPVLANLTLLSKSYDGEELVFHPYGFKSLTKLSLSEERLRSILVENESALQKLVSLELIGILPAIQAPDNQRILGKIISTRPSTGPRRFLPSGFKL